MSSENLQPRGELAEPRAPRAALTLADFELLRRIGDGSFSQVLLARHKATSREYALKVVDKQHVMRHNSVDQVRRERNLLDRLTYDGIVRLYFTFQDALSLYFGQEYCPGGELYDQIRAKGVLDTETARFYAAEIVLMLEALQQEGIVHRDLKPENLLLTASGHLKLIDFGSAKDLRADPDTVLVSRGSIDLRPKGSGGSSQTAAAAANTKTNAANSANAANSGTAEAEAEESFGAQADAAISSNEAVAAFNNYNTGPPPSSQVPPNKFKPKRAVTLVGTADYVSPEILQNEPISYTADFWALGCVIYQMFAGRPPFKSATEYLTFQLIVAGEYPELPETVPLEAKDLVSALLKVKPEERLGAGGIEEIKNHPFFSGIDWEGIREISAPEPAVIDTDSVGSAASSFDWELQSLVAALPKIPSRGDIDLDGVGLELKNS